MVGEVMLMEHEQYQIDIKNIESVDLTDIFRNYKYLIKRYEDMKRTLVPFKVGDRVRITKVPEIKEDSGWYTYRGCLKKGRMAKVLDISWHEYGHKFMALIEMEVSSWIDSITGEEHIDDNPHCFYWDVEDLKMVK